METFELKGKDFIELNKLMKLLNMVGSGGEAKFMISQGEVDVNGKAATEVRKKLRAGDQIVFNGAEIQIQ